MPLPSFVLVAGVQRFQLVHSIPGQACRHDGQLTSSRQCLCLCSCARATYVPRLARLPDTLRRHPRRTATGAAQNVLPLVTARWQLDGLQQVPIDAGAGMQVWWSAYLAPSVYVN